MRVYALDHVQLAMPRGLEDQARSFYRDVLGLTEITKPPGLAKRGGVWFSGGDLHLHLGVEEDFRPARKAHPALLVEDLAELVALCESAGYEVAHDAGDLHGYNHVYVTDPFGNRVELMERVAAP
ncbi:MAG TPA: VOC family protein [Longimicrobium sp.]|nr:VOC family protein [Longimicrobium sp.]